MNIAVFLASVMGSDEKYANNAAALGAWIGNQGHTLIYGGANCGCMRELAEAAQNNGAAVIGVMPSFMVEKGRQRQNLDELIITETMNQRKQIMMEKADIFIVLPGGPGTLEEAADVISAHRLGLLKGECLFLNLKGYYDPLKQLFVNMQENGMVATEDLTFISFPDSLESLTRSVSAL